MRYIALRVEYRQSWAGDAHKETAQHSGGERVVRANADYLCELRDLLLEPLWLDSSGHGRADLLSRQQPKAEPACGVRFFAGAHKCVLSLGSESSSHWSFQNG